MRGLEADSGTHGGYGTAGIDANFYNNKTSENFPNRPSWAKEPNVKALNQFAKTAKFKFIMYKVAKAVLGIARLTDEGRFVVDTMLGAAWEVGGLEQPSLAPPRPHDPPRCPTLRRWWNTPGQVLH